MRAIQLEGEIPPVVGLEPEPEVSRTLFILNQTIC